MICPPDHSHEANRTCYRGHGCRCDACRGRNAAYTRNRYRKLAYGTWDTGMVDAEPVRQHIHKLQAYGYGIRQIVTVTGAPYAAVNRCAYHVPYTGKLSETIKRETAEKVLAMRPDITTLAPSALIPSTGMKRRVHALARMGWGFPYIAERLGMAPSNLRKSRRRPRVLVATHLAVARLYDELWDKTPTGETPHERAVIAMNKKRAIKNGWAAPLSWDDIDFDDAPVTTERQRILAGEELTNEIEWLVDGGVSAHDISRTLGKTLEALEHHAWRHKRNDLASALREKAVA